jgi:predicted nucleic acid-binding protein
MAWLLDTGVLLRLVDHRDPLHAIVLQYVETLTNQNEEIFTTTQNIAEFWNVATRPATENGLGLPISSVSDLLEHIIEPTCALLFEPMNLYAEFKRLVTTHAVSGRKVHDARLVAMMLVWNIDKVFTLNDRDFRRFESDGIRVFSP